MKRLFGFVIVGLSISACTGSSVSDRPNCSEWACVSMQVASSVRLNEPFPVMITVQPEVDIPGLKIYLAAVPPNVVFEGDRQWTVDARAHQNITVRGIVSFTEEGLYYVLAEAYNPYRGGGTTDSVRVHFTRSGGTIYLPGTKIPITPVVIITPSSPLLSPSGTIIPTPSRVIVLPPTSTRPPTPTR